MKLRKTLAMAAGTLMLAGGAVTAAQTSAVADGTDPGDELVEVGSNGYCTYSKWGGRFLCGSQTAHRLPNGHTQVFVIGTNNVPYTKWSSGSGVSGWKSMGGKCIKGNKSMGVEWANGWNFAVTCIGGDRNRWYNERYTSGHWSGWDRTRT
ncbi:hypothetical protein AB0I06_16495 [Streptomyces sp. NPDC050674]|uniref:hypothetical protein n=1 Tax=Streptomyces sp. NPDC050674 TaxID=3157216 RepID=UPI0034395D92